MTLDFPFVLYIYFNTEMAAELRAENIELKEKLEETKQELEAYHAKMEAAVMEGERKIAALQCTVSEEIMVS